MKRLINKNYEKLITATFITRFGDSVDAIAFSWLVYVMTGSRVLMGSIFAISILPNLIVLPFSGVIADVYNKKKITLMGDLFRGVSVATLALIYFLGYLEVWHLFVFVSINSLFESFANPARGSMLQSLVEPDDYMKGASWLGTSSNIGSLVGLAVASILIGVIGVWGAMFVDAATFFLSSLLVLLISFQDKKTSDTTRPKVKDYFILIKEGVTYLRTKHLLVVLLFLAAFLNFALVPLNVLRPIYVVEVLNLSVEGLSYLGIAILVGMIVGGYGMGAKGKNIKPIKAIGIGLVLIGLMYSMLGLPEYLGFGSTFNITYAVLVSFLMGVCLPIVQAPLQTMIMKTTDPNMIGRLSSIMGVVVLCSMPLGGFFVSLIGDSISVSFLFVLMGASSVVVSLWFWVKNRNAVLV